MRKIFALLAIVLGIGCAPGSRTAVTSHDGVYSPQPTVLDTKSWSIKFSPQWDVNVRPADAIKKDEISVEVVAQTKKTYGVGPAVFALATIDLTNIPEVVDGTFASRYSAAVEADKNNLIIKSKPIMFDGVPSHLMFYINNTSAANIVLITDKSRKGYVLRCIGDAERIDSFAPLCGNVIGSFSMK